MSFFTQMSYADSGSLDAFSRLRVSNANSVISIQDQYTAGPIQMESAATGAGVTPAYDGNTRMVTLSCTNTGTSFTQSYIYSPYMPGHSQVVAMTGVLGTGVASTTVDVGLFDAGNGIIFRQNGNTNLQFILRTSTSGSVSNANIVAQSAWSIDKFDGTGPSGITLDVTKTFILVIDYQYLGMGRVRLGFDINGVLYYAHQFLNANMLTVPYMQQPALPVQMLITSTGGSKTAYFKCATVQSEGGDFEALGFRFSTPESTATAGNGARVPIISLRHKTTFNSISNRQLLLPEAVNLNVTGANSVFWELVVGGAYGGQSFSDVNSTYSGMEYSSTPGTFTNLTGGIVVMSGYVPGAGSGSTAAPSPIRVTISPITFLRTPLSLDRSGAVRAMGTLTLLVSGLGATSATRATISYLEVR